MLAAAAAGPSALWYLTRGTGATALILLTVSVALGVINVRRVSTPEVPRFVLEAVHRNASLLALAFLVVHIGTAVIDPFAPIRVIDAAIPFTSAYRPLWLGLGAIAFDLLLAVAITSLLRRRVGFKSWRATHWLAYASWPVALVHGLGTGTDAKTTWMLALSATCVLVVLASVAARVAAGWPERIGTRATAAVTAAIVPIGLLVWLPSGPLAAGWAKRAGTPSTLLVAAASGSGAGLSAFTAQANGTVTQGEADEGQAEVYISLTLSGQQLSHVGIRLFGKPVSGGGLKMTSSRVSLGTASDPTLYRGSVTSLNGTDAAAVVGSGSTRAQIVAQLQLDAQTNNATGTVQVQP
jgi:methionine sulfoxide reductase heme-binding subunit